MANLLKLCKKYFGKKDLYEVFEISKDATEKDIRRAYHRLSLKVHPDRVDEDDKTDATEKFKVVSAIHAILSKKSKRDLYDKTGSIENDDDDHLDIDNWRQYWQSIFKEITEQDIINYEQKYKNSEEENYDLKKAYVNHKGDMNRILECVLFSSPNDEPRFDVIIRKWIDEDEVPAFDKYTNEPKSRKENRKRKYEKEAKLAAIAAKKSRTDKSDISQEEDLMKAIQSRQTSRAASGNDFLEKLAQKYGGKNQPKGRKKK